MNLLQSIAYPLGSFPKGTYDAFVISLFPLYLATFTQNTALIGILVTISAFENAILSLLVGPLTDKTSSKIGRRKIYILSGTILTSLLLLLYPFAQNITFIIILIILSGFTANIISAPHLALITKNSEKNTRSQVVALIGIFYLLGQIVLTVLALVFWNRQIDSSLFIVLAILFVLPTIPLLFFARDETKPDNPSQKLNFKSYLAFFKNQNRNIYLLSQLLLWFGINSVLPFFTLFVKSYLQLPQQKAIIFYLIIVLASGISAYPLALLGKKLKEGKVFQIGLLFLLLAGILGIFARQMPEFVQYLIALFAGIGNGATAAFSYSIFSKLVNDDQIGMASGIHTFVMTGIAPIAAMLSGFLIGSFGYPSMFVLLAITTTACLFLLNKQNVNAN